MQDTVVSTILQKMKRTAILAVLLMIGCAGPFSRAVPTESEYKQRFLTLLQPDQIDNLQFSYHGAVGGEASIARFKLNTDAISQIRANAQREENYAFEDENVAKELKRRIAFGTRAGRIPEWFDFPFDRPMRLFIDSGESTAEHPAYSREWYVDQDRSIVYFVMSEG